MNPCVNSFPYRIALNAKFLRSTRNIQLTVSKYSSSTVATNKAIPFKEIKDRFNCITIDTINESGSLQDLKIKLQDSLNRWIREQRRCIWFKVDIKHADFVPVLAENGFNFYNAREDVVVMFKWLAEGPSQLPPASFTNLTVGVVVLNDKEQLLAVTEKSLNFPHWKVPTGYVDRGEDIASAAIREVKEETGIDAEYESIVAIAHSNDKKTKTSDMYALVHLHATSELITPCAREIKACEWMPLEKYMKHPNVSEYSKALVKKVLDMRRKGVKLSSEKMTFKYPSHTVDSTVISV